jgi:hypothetical protein
LIIAEHWVNWDSIGLRTCISNYSLNEAAFGQPWTTLMILPVPGVTKLMCLAYPSLYPFFPSLFFFTSISWNHLASKLFVLTPYFGACPQRKTK